MAAGSYAGRALGSGPAFVPAPASGRDRELAGRVQSRRALRQPPVQERRPMKFEGGAAAAALPGPSESEWLSCLATTWLTPDGALLAANVRNPFRSGLYTVLGD